MREPIDQTSPRVPSPPASRAGAGFAMRAATVAIGVVIAAVVGVMAATSLTCGVGLLRDTTVWCGMGFVWMVAIPAAAFFGLLFGLPAWWLARRLHLRRWWQHALLGLLAALPAWYGLAQPFASPRWQAAGVYDTLNTLGAGLLAGLAWSLISRRV